MLVMGKSHFTTCLRQLKVSFAIKILSKLDFIGLWCEVHSESVTCWPLLLLFFSWNSPNIWMKEKYIMGCEAKSYNEKTTI
jgi:hypothetical protein